MEEHKQLRVPEDTNTKQNPDTDSTSVVPPEASVSAPKAIKKPSKLHGLFNGFGKPKVLLKAVAVLLGIALVFYGGYVFAIYQVSETGSFSLPHFNVNSANNPACINPCEYDSDYPNGEIPPGCSQEQIDDTLCAGADKPVIYLYPTHAEKINVKVSYSPGFSKTVPAYSKSNGWEVIAQPDGTLTNLANSKTYPYLFWEGKPDPSLHFDMSTGFVVAGSDTNIFLQRQLTSIGLNQSEVSSFITYWLPKMESNPYNLIHFAGSEYTNIAKLRISPEPNSLLRVFMAYKPLPSPVKIAPQTFPVFHRAGFTAVEWGGTELL